MVTCTECGAKNKEDAKFCSECGAALGQVFRKEKHPKDECFGLQNSGAIAGIVFGLMIVILGLSWAFGWEINFMAYLVLVFGALIVAGAIYKLTRKRS